MDGRSFIRHNYKNDCYIFGNFCAYTVKTASSEAYPLKDYIEERAVEIACYIVENKGTVRQAAKKFGISKSTVHKDCTERLIQINPTLGLEVRQVLDRNKSERHIRGGIATREKYLLMHENHHNADSDY